MAVRDVIAWLASMGTRVALCSSPKPRTSAAGPHDALIEREISLLNLAGDGPQPSTEALSCGAASSGFLATQSPEVQANDGGDQRR
jgi:hypothetical protein